MGTTDSLTNAQPDTDLGRFFCVMCSCWSLSAFGFVIVVFTADGRLLAPFWDRINFNTSHHAHGCLSYFKLSPLTQALVKVTVMILVAVPAALLVFCGIFGGVLATMASSFDMTYSEGFFFLAAQLTLMTNPLAESPDLLGEHWVGKVLVIIVGAWGLGILSVLIGLMGAPMVAPLLDALHLTLTWKPSVMRPVKTLKRNRDRQKRIRIQKVTVSLKRRSTKRLDIMDST